MFALKLSAKCQTIGELVAVLDRAKWMISAGCKFSSRNDHGAAAFGFEITYDDQEESWVTYPVLLAMVGHGGSPAGDSGACLTPLPPTPPTPLTKEELMADVCELRVLNLTPECRARLDRLAAGIAHYCHD